MKINNVITDAAYLAPRPVEWDWVNIGDLLTTFIFDNCGLLCFDVRVRIQGTHARLQTNSNGRKAIPVQTRRWVIGWPWKFGYDWKKWCNFIQKFRTALIYHVNVPLVNIYKREQKNQNNIPCTHSHNCWKSKQFTRWETYQSNIQQPTVFDERTADFESWTAWITMKGPKSRIYIYMHRPNHAHRSLCWSPWHPPYRSPKRKKIGTV